MKKSLPGFTAESSIHSRDGRSYKSGAAEHGPKSDTVVPCSNGPGEVEEPSATRCDYWCSYCNPNKWNAKKCTKCMMYC